jgi:eukaryotic-like serine/threonine-protein kinase
VSKGTLFAMSFDVSRLEVQGPPVPVLEKVSYSSGNGSAQIDASRIGTLLYRTGGAGTRLVTVQWLDSQGKTTPLLTKPGAYERPRLSPDGRRLAIEATDSSNAEIWLYDTTREILRRVTSGLGGDPGPVWMPDGRHLIFEAPGGMFSIDVDGGTPQPLTTSKNLQFPWSVTTDGAHLAYMEASPGTTGYRVWTLPITRAGAALHAGTPVLVTQGNLDERHPAFSPDGRWLAYTSNESGTFQIYVRAYPPAASGAKWQISSSGGVYPAWNLTAHQLVWRTEDNILTTAAYSPAGETFVADKPRPWTTTRLADVGFTMNFDLDPSGKRIAALMPAGPPQDQTHVIFVENFFDQLRQLVPARK